MLAICLGAPIAEVFDRWDDTARDGYDTEANLDPYSLLPKWLQPRKSA